MAVLALAMICFVFTRAQAGVGDFSFGITGDHGNHAESQAVFDAANKSGINFFQTSGDLSYNETSTQAFCDMVNTTLGSSIPFLMLNGNHEEPAKENSSGDNTDVVIAPGCLPRPSSSVIATQDSPNLTGDRGTSTTNYGREYYYDYPLTNPSARIIAISADIDTYQGGLYDYTAGSAHYNWVQSKIQEAKAAGLWTIVVNHTPYMNTGASHGAQSYPTVHDVFNMMLDEKVDLILNSHDHNYQRSKQLTGDNCAYTESVFDANCIVNAASTGYTAGSGSVLVITGTGGGNLKGAPEGLNDINGSDPDFGYFAATMGSNSPNQAYGFSKFDVTPTQITGSFVPGTGQTGGFTDTFTITRSSGSGSTDTTPPATSLTAPAANATLSGTATLTADATDNIGVTRVEFYTGTTKIGESTSSPYSLSWNTQSVANGTYSLTSKAFDAAGNQADSTAVSVTVSNATTTPAPTFDYSTTPSTEVDAIRKAVMNVTAGTCNNFVSGTTASPTGVTVPETGVTMLGGFDFSINCTAAGGQATIDITLGKLYPDTSKLRFYKKTATSAPTDVTSQFTVRNTATATVATYTIVDGVNFDSDATVNGVLDDPLYVGVLGATDSTTPVDTAAGSGRGALADTGQAIVPFLLASVVLFGSAKAVHNWKAKRYKLHA